MQITTDTPRPLYEAVIGRRKIARGVADKSDKLMPITT